MDQHAGAVGDGGHGAVGLHGDVVQLVDVFLLADVDLDEHGLAAGGLDGVDGLLALRGVEVRADDLGAFLGPHFRDRAAQAGINAGDNCDFTFHSSHNKTPPLKFFYLSLCSNPEFPQCFDERNLRKLPPYFCCSRSFWASLPFSPSSGIKTPPTMAMITRKIAIRVKIMV